MYVCILQQDNTQNIKPEGQQGSEALTAARSKKCLEQILATTHNMISQYDLTIYLTKYLTSQGNSGEI